MNFRADPAEQLSESQRSRFDDLVLEFEENWSADRLPRFASRLDDLEAELSACVLHELVLIDLERHWTSGKEKTVESYLELFPSLGTPKSCSENLIQTEINCRAAAGEAIDPASIRLRFGARDVPFEFPSPAAPGRTPDHRDTQTINGEDTSRAADRIDFGSPKVRELPREFGPYRIIRRIADGGMGAVYLAEDTRLYDRQVAIKVPHFTIHSQRDEEFARRFMAEARAASRLDEHPNLCSVHEIGNLLGVDYIAMTYIEGRSLDEVLKSGKAFTDEEVAALIAKIARAIEFAHDRDIIHRDLKPANVMLNSRGEPIVMDFGLARLVDDTDTSRLTNYGALIGTPAYMSPEQIRADPGAVDQSADIFSLGVILYRLLAGRLPYTGSLGEILSAVLRDDPEPPSRFQSRVDPYLQAICLKMLAKAPEDRFASMGQVASELERFSKRFTPQPSPRLGGVFPFVVGCVVSCLLLFGFGLAVRTKHGTVRFEIETDQIQLQIDDERFSVQDLATPQSLDAGFHSLAVEVAGAKVPLGGEFTIDAVDYQGRAKLLIEIDGVALSADEFRVTRGDTHVMHVELVHLEDDTSAGDVASASGDPVAENASFDPATTAGALEFNGIDSYVSIPSFRFDGSHPLTIEAVATPTADIRDGHLVSNTQEAGFCLALQRRRWRFFVRDLESYRRPESPAVLFRTIHLAAVYRKHEASLFVDGKVVQRIRVDHPHRPSPQSLFLGAEPTATNQARAFFAGLLHEVRLSRTPRYEYDFEPPRRMSSDENTLAYYDFGESSGSILHDRSGNGHDGTIHNATWRTDWTPPPAPRDEWKFEHHRTIVADPGSVRSLAISPDEKLLAVGSASGIISLWDLKSGDQTRSIDVESQSAIDAMFVPGGKTLAVCGWDKQIRFLDPESGTQRSAIDIPDVTGRHANVGVEYTPDGRHLFSGGWDRRVIKWNVATGKREKTFAYGLSRVHAIALRPDASQIAAAGDVVVTIWDADTGAELHQLAGHGNVVASLCYSHDGSRLLTGGRDGVVCVWDCETGKQRDRWLIGESVVNLRWFGDDSRVVLKDGTGTARLLDATDGTQLGCVHAHIGSVGNLALFDQDRMLVTCSDRGLAKIWRIRPATAVAEKPSPAGPAGPEGKPNRSLYCDGVTSHIRVPELRYDGTHPLTMEAWLRLPESHAARFDTRPAIISQNDGRGMSMLMVEGALLLGVNASMSNIVSNEPLPVGAWNHVALVFDPPTRRLFVNGRLQIERDDGEFRPSAKDFLIAADPTNASGTDRHLRCLIDEVRFSRSARYETDFAPPRRHVVDDDTLVLYQFDEESEETAADASANEYDGIIARGRIATGDLLPRGFDRSINVDTEPEGFDSFASAFGNLASKPPTRRKDYDENTQAKQPPSHGNHAGSFFVETGGGWHAWNALFVRRGLVEISARVAEGKTAFATHLTNTRIRRGVRVAVKHNGEIVFGNSLFQAEKDIPDQVIAKVNPKATGEFHRLGIAIHDHAVQVFWDDEPISGVLKTPFGLTPCAVSLGNHGAGRVEFDHIAHWQPFEARDVADSQAVAQRRLAEWAFDNGGYVVTRSRRKFTSAAQLPKFFEMTGLVVRTDQPIDEELAALIPELTSLTRLEVSAANWNDPKVVAHYARCSSVRSLWAFGQIPETLAILGSATNLESLSLPYSTITDDDLQVLSSLTNLVGLNLARAQITGTGLRHLHDCKKLVSLDLGTTRLTAEGVRALSIFPELQVLDMRLSELPQSAYASLGDLSSLRQLTLLNASVEDEGLEGLARLRQLAMLDLRGTRVSEAAVQRIAAELPQCKIKWDGGEIAPR